MRKSIFIELYDKIPKPAKVSFWFTICNFMQKGIAILSIPIITRMLSTQEYGVYSVFLSWTDILLVFTSLYLFGNSFNVGMKENEDRKNQYMSSMNSLCIILTFICFLVYMIFFDDINMFSGLSYVFWIIMFLSSLTRPGLDFWSVSNRYDFKYKALLIVTLFISVFTPLSKIILIKMADFMGEDRSIAAAFGNILPTFIIGLFLTCLLIARGKKGYVRRYWSFGLKFNIPLIPYYLSLKILDQSDRIMIDYYIGSTATGIYSLAYTAASVMIILNSSINSGYIPWQFKVMADKRNREVVNTTNIILAAIVVINLLLIGAAPEILTLLAPQSYFDAIYVIPPIAISCFFRFLGQVFINIEFYYEKNKYTSLAAVCSAALNVGLNALLIPRFGYLAAGYTTLFCYVVNMLFHYLMAVKITKRNGDVFCFRMKTIILQSITAVAFSFILMLTYENVMLRYALLVSLATVAVLNRKRLKVALHNVLH
jgi:O-antigen/teichoic acid export membrane protein